MFLLFFLRKTKLNTKALKPLNMAQNTNTTESKFNLKAARIIVQEHLTNRTSLAICRQLSASADQKGFHYARILRR